MSQFLKNIHEYIISNFKHISNLGLFFSCSGGYECDEACCCGGSCSCSKWQTKLFTNINIKRADVPLAWGLYFQDGASPSFEGIVDLHNRIMFYLVVILFGVGWIMLSIIWNFNKSSNKLVYRYLNHGTLIELVWTVGPALVLVAIAFPSFKLLYLMDEVIDPAMTVKVTGWFLKLINLYFYSINFSFNSLILHLCYYNKYIYNFVKSIHMSKYFHTLVKARNRIGPHDKDVISLLIGSLLGDCYASKRYVEGTRFIFKQSIIHKNYLFWLYNFFFERGYCSKLKPRLYTRIIKKDKESKVYYGYEFNTYTFRSFDWIYKIFYKKGKKLISYKIKNYLTPLALAIWISDDGGWVGHGVRISCNAYTLEEVKLLIRILNENFGLVCTIQNIYIKDRYSIYIKSQSIPLLKSIVFPHLHSSMLYKIGLNTIKS